MLQRCHLANIYASWVIYLAGAVVWLASAQYLLLVAWLVVLPLAQVAYVRAFPRISSYIGYGRIQDESPQDLLGHAQTTVTLYTALGCPFCPVIDRRLEELRPRLGFVLNRVDVTMRPDVLREKGIRSVPTVSVGDRRLIGLATSSQLADLILGRATAA